VELLNRSLGDLGDAFARNRAMDQQTKEHELDRQMRQRLLDEQVKGREQVAELSKQGKETFYVTDDDGNTHKIEGPPGMAEKMTAAGKKVSANPPQVTKPIAITYDNGLVKATSYANDPEEAAKYFNQMKTNLGAGTKATGELTPGSAVYDRATGALINKNPSAASMSQTGFVETKKDIPVEATPEKAHVDPGMFGWKWGPFGTKVVDAPAQEAYTAHETTRIPRGSAFPPPPTETATNAPAAAPEPVPQAAQREVGKTYTLPKGRFTWTGSGWVPAQ
jgi:hypothetical protein